MTDLMERRDLLKTTGNPNKALDYLIMLEDDTLGQKITVRYIPDRDILNKDSFKAYLETLPKEADTIERANMIMQDLANELVARWIQVCLSDSTDGTQQSVFLEEHQPQWENPTLMARLAPI